jgi:hypothetical protein
MPHHEFSPSPEIKRAGDLITNFEATAAAILEIEKTASDEVESDKRGQSDLKSRIANARLLVMEEKRSSGFEGFGGFNRYRIEKNGTVVLQKSHSTRRCVAKARELGIEVE